MKTLIPLNEGFPLISVKVDRSKAYPKMYLLADKMMCDDYMHWAWVFFLVSIIKNHDSVKMCLNICLNGLKSSCKT